MARLSRRQPGPKHILAETRIGFGSSGLTRADWSVPQACILQLLMHDGSSLALFKRPCWCRRAAGLVAARKQAACLRVLSSASLVRPEQGKHDDIVDALLERPRRTSRIWYYD